MKGVSLFWNMLKIGCIGFGGGSALIPVMHKVFVVEQEAVGETEFEEAVVVASITPGALTIKLAGEIGRQIAGWKGMLLSASAMALPGVFLMIVLLSLTTNLSPALVGQMEFLSIGVMAYIICMLTDYVLKTVVMRPKGMQGHLSIGIIILVFLLSCGNNICRLMSVQVVDVFHLSNLEIFLLTFVLIFIKCCFSKSRMSLSHNAELKWSDTMKEVLVALLVVLLALLPSLFVTKEALLYAGNGILSSLISFGGGDAYLTVADGLFVGTGLVAEDMFYGAIIPLANLLPGSILCKVLSGIGYVMGGYAVALLGFACSFTTSCGIVSVVGSLYRGMGELPVFQIVKQWIRPVVSGLMLNVILSLVCQTHEIGEPVSFHGMYVGIMGLIYLVNLFLHYKKVSNIKMVIISVAMALILCNMVG
ncbi:MAG: chromate transporter [Agathobacter sp.]|nr:chromate transporter [Agathobacter sp.]